MATTTELKTANDHVEHLSKVQSATEFANEKDQLDHDQARQLAVQYDPNSPELKKLVRKLDWRILPCCWCLYLLGFLDRANIGNAKTAGLEDDFGLTSEQYSIIVLIFFVSYLVCEVPANMILTRVRPSIWLPSLALVWGTFAALMGATQTWRQLAGLRFLLGFAEAGFPAGCAFYLSCWYRRYELATRFAFLYTSVPLAGAISGLLAGLITEYMDNAAGIAGWRWLFVSTAFQIFTSPSTESFGISSLLSQPPYYPADDTALDHRGVASVVAAILVFLLLPDYPSTSKRYLNAEERLLACNRLAVDGIALAQGAGTEKIPHWTAFKMTVNDWRVWAQCFLFVLVTGSQTMQYFIPTLVGSFGWEGHVGQYHTIPAYMAALVYVVACCYLADKYKTKWPFICGLSGVGCVLFIAVTTSTNKMVQYVLTIFAFGTIYGCSPLVKTWVADVIPQPAAKRAIAIALINSIGNASSIYSTWLWPKKDAPRYIPGFATTTTWLGVLCVSTVVFSRLFKKYPVEKKDHTQTMAAELRARREAASKITTV